MTTSSKMVLLFKRSPRSGEWKFTFHDLDNENIRVITAKGNFDSIKSGSLASVNTDGELEFIDNPENIKSEYALEEKDNTFSLGNLLKCKAIGNTLVRLSGSPELSKEFSLSRGYQYNPSYLVG